MAKDNAAYADQLMRLFPPGKAWSRDPASQHGQLMLALGDEFARVDARGDQLIEEAFPDSTDEMLPDWERIAGLPDPAIPTPVSRPDRLAALRDQLVSRGDPRPAALIAIVERLGFTATITTHTPFAAGVGYAGMPLYDQLSIFWFEVNVTAPIGTPTPIVALEHYVRRQAPLHTFATFNYTLV